MHQISVTGDTEYFLPSVKLPENIKAEIKDKTVTFTSENKTELENFKELLVNPIVNVIETKYRDALIKREFRGTECSLTHTELADAISDIKSQTRAEDYQIKEKLRAFLATSDILSIEGFVNFRLREYKNKIRRLSSEAAGSALLNRECRELTQLLRQFIALQPPLFDVLHIIVTCCGGYIILDENHTDITRACADETAKAFMSSEISFDDIILSVLITSAPKKIIIHGAKYIKTAGLAEMIKSIFAPSVVFCGNCEVCTHYTEKK